MEDINKLYQEGKATREIGQIIGKSHTWVRKNLNPELKRKINPKDRLLNHEAFSNPESKEVNYWAGFIASDGCISQDKVNGRVTIVSCDIDVLEKFKKFVNSSNKILKCGNCKRIEITSQQICDDLNRYWNLTEKKSLTLTPPNISKEMIPHFIRGVFDGDGSVSNKSKANKNKTTSPASNADICTASKEFAEWLLNVIPTNMKWQSSKRQVLYRVRVWNYSDVINFLNWIYKDSKEESRMNRKYLIYEELLNYN